MQPYTQLTLFELPEPEYVSLTGKLGAYEAIRRISLNDPRFGSFVGAIYPKTKTLGVALDRLRAKKHVCGESQFRRQSGSQTNHGSAAARNMTQVLRSDEEVHRCVEQA